MAESRLRKGGKFMNNLNNASENVREEILNRKGELMAGRVGR